ncbi:hypothetical protein PVAND_000386 [Polypedilum vanderplanki]|uniref:Chorein N-terminal domain-containing protein n=1 Tax=Polypedilum vanderplanki TaxID=319348 RepID=A0A9J6BKH0_POLVA|nr:hypothetical protein PVAND_000386 [Polypedilum vanderplanki]
MFSIENYITGLITSKVQKFVKNINPNEFKVSLWEGNVVFQNLELKLDVLDEELQLPFTFISGHLQFMKLEIPWTKIATEPITTTINDLELVLKLKDIANLPPTRKVKKKKTSIEEDSSAGYLASLITKIVNNISIICNNISIKFLEDDIVFSMNVQHLSIYSADSKWKRAFIDVASSSNVIFRKLINIIDLTICLDKRNSVGKIEYVQEPFLYKCSIELRVFRKYNPISPEKHSITRIDLQTKALNINVSSQQFPMIIRLINLILALKSGKLQESYGMKQPQTTTSENAEENEESWMSWMWNNIVPTIIADEQQSDDLDINSKKIFEFGTYIENAYLSLKSQDLLHDPIIPSAKTAILKPLIEFYFKETFAITVICGRKHFNVKGGFDYVEVKALDNCPCGTVTGTKEECILKVGNSETSGKYLIESYFDKNYKNNNRYEEMFSNYFEKNTEETFLSKVSAMAFDIYHTIEIPDDRASSDFGSDLEYSNLTENYVIRVYGDGILINVTSDAIHRIEKLVQYYKDCEFVSYVKEEKIPIKSQLSPATADDYEALINEIPTRNIIVKLKNSKLLVKEWSHERSLRTTKKYARQSSLFDISKKEIVDLEVKIGEFSLSIEVPLYKNRLIYTACQLPDNINNQLFKKCFSVVKTNVKNVMVDMKHEGTKKICEILKISSTQKSLIYPNLWEEFDIQENYFDIEFNGLSFMMNPAQFIVFYRVILSIIQENPTGEIEKDLLNNLNNSQLVVLQLTSRILKGKIFKLQQAHIAEFTISDLIGLSWKSGMKSTVLNMPDTTFIPAFFSSKMKNFKSESMLNVNIQIPINSSTAEQSLLTTIMIEMSGGCVNLDPLLREFLSFKLFQTTPQKKVKEFNRTLSTSTKPQLTEFSNVQQSSAHSSSEYQETICPSTEIPKVNKDLLYYFKMCRNLVVYVNLKPLEFYYSTSILESLKASDSIRDIVQSNGSNTIVLKTPNISFHSVKNKLLSKFISPHFSSSLPGILWGNENCLTWNLELKNMHVFIIGSDRKKFDVVQNASVKVSIADESQLDEKEMYTGNILIEIFPLYLNFHTSQIDLINLAVNDLCNFSILNPSSKSTQDIVELNEQENAPNLDLKDFLGLPTGSTITKTSLHDGGAKKSKSNINFYIQWICSKISLTSFIDTLPIHKKFILEIDEILFSLHQQEFFQLKCKVTSISGNFFHLINDKWTKNLNLGFNVQSEENISDTVSRFLDMTVTKAETLNVHSKWNLELKRSTQLILNDVSEINIVLQSFDVIASDEFIHFLPILKLFQRPNDKNQKAFMQYSGSELPLIHLRCNGFRIFLPNLHKTSNYNVLILKVNSLQVSPNAVNNLIRTQILRPDIHSKASHLGVLDLVGSKIEDRQYQLLIKGCSLTSSNWNEITAIITEKNVENYDNPATIWNNFENGPSSPNFKFYTIFKDSSFSFIYAPCIKFKEVLVAGAAIEINCIENMNILTSLEQMILFIDLVNQMKNIADTFSVSDDKKSLNATTIEEKPKKFQDKKSFDDSGVASTISHSNQMKSKKFLSKKQSIISNENGQLIPYEFTFTSSKFNLNFTIEEKNYNVLLDTPNLYITQNRTDKILNISLYDLKIDYETINIFSTRHGNIDAISGITPFLLRVKITEKTFKNTDLKIEIKKSIFLQITESGIVEFLRVHNILQHHSVAYENIKEIQPLPINSKVRKFDTIKSFMKNFKTLNLSTDQIVTEFKSEKNHLKIGLHHMKGKLKLFDRPEKIESNLDVEHLTIQCEEKLFLHPLSIETKAKITQEYWKKNPLIYLNIAINYLKVDIWPNVIKQFHNFAESIKTLAGDKNYLNHLNDSESENNHGFNRIQIFAGSLKVKNDNETIEHFLDDLRSGIYTFVEIETPFQELPLPYQIHYQDNSIICWRYPLPRALHKIKIFPVPFQTQNELKIQCKIEYYSQLKSQFEELMSLCLIENETKILDLNPNVPFSEIWRIKFQVNLKRDSDDDEEEAEISNYLQMHPKVLLACLRIDSYYKPLAIPSINTLLKISKIQANLMNENEERHEAVKVNIDSLQIVSQHYDENCENLNIEGEVAVDVKDYGCDNLIPFFKNFQIKSSFDINHDDINFNFITNTIRLKYSSAIGHSLITTSQIWKNVFENSLEQTMIDSTKYSIHNNTASTICINQLDTNELIYILPKSSKRYQFYTDKLKQTLQLSVALQFDEWSEKTESFCINQEGVQYVKVNDHQYFIITVKNISNYQRKIIIDGQVLIYNGTKENFTVQYKRYDKDINTADKCEVQFLDLDTHSNGSLFGSCEFDSQQTIRLHLKRSERKAFSGEIPLREIVVNNKPWLVKVPLGANNNFICFWVRIIRQNIENEICRVLVLICPVFIAKSLFPSNIVLSEEATKENYEIKGCGDITEIDMKGTHEDEHTLIFPSQFVQQDRSPAVVTLSYKLINKNSFFKIPDEFSDITKAIEKIEEKRNTFWPCARDEEYQCIRNFTMHQTVSTLYELSPYEQDSISCSLMLTLIPWCIFINSSGCVIKLTNISTNDACLMATNDMMVPFYIENVFTISIEIDGEWIQSDFIYINNDSKKRSSNSYELQLEGSVTVNMNHEIDTLQLTLSSTCVGKKRTIFIGSMLIVTNHSKYDLGVIPFCVDMNERIETMKRNDFPIKRYVELYKNVKLDNFKFGNPITYFSNLSKNKSKRKFGTNYTSFIIIRSIHDNDFSCPIKIQQTLRKCINVSNGDESVSLCISILKHNEQYFLSIFNDSVPILSIRNNTDFNLYVAQTDLKAKTPTTKHTLPHREIFDDRFSWFQVITSRQSVFYTPPVFNEHFPEIISHDYGLIFACVSGNDLIRWSLPVKIDETKKIIIHVPMFGDLKLIIDMKKITSEISINYIDSDETLLSIENTWESAQMCFAEMSNSSHQKTFSLSKKRSQSRVINFNMYLEGVTLTIYKDSNTEKRIDLLSLRVDDIISTFSKQSRKLKVNFSKLQVDNELFPTGNYDFPVLLCNKDMPKRIDEQDLSTWDVYEIIQRHQHLEKFSIEIDFYEHDRHIQNISIQILPIRIYIEDGFISVLLEIVEDCLPTNLLYKKQEMTLKTTLKNGLVLIPNTIIDQSSQLSKPIRLNSFRLEALHVLLSVHACRRVYIALDHSPLDFSVYEKINIYTVPMKFGNSVGMHYVSSAIFGAGWVVGGLEILGSPSSLTRSFTTGFKDFVSMPLQGMLKGPFGFLIGLTQGSASLFKNVTTGTLNSVTKLANSLARNLDHLTLDNEHIDLKTDALRRSRPQGFTDGLQLGLTGFGINILGAIGGLARHPLQAKSAVDVVTGVGKGILGVFTKPISGIAELVAFMGSGMLQSVGYNVLPNPLNSHRIENDLSVPNAEKIISKQLPHHSADMILMTCRATFIQKNDLKYAFLILISKSLIIVDLEKDSITDVILLEKLSPIMHKSTTSPDNLFVFKLKSDEEEETSAIEKYHVSKRTVQYIKQLSNQHVLEHSSSDGDNENDDEESNTDVQNNKISFYIDEATGRYLLNYINFMKHQASFKETFFPLFEL